MTTAPCRQRVRCLAAAALLTAIALPSAAGSPAPSRDPFLARLAGHWSVEGQVRGRAVRYDGRARWVLHDGWLRLALRDTAKPSTYEADVDFGFDSKATDYVVHWLDRFGAAGARVVATGQRDGATLVFTFPYAEGEFRDTLTLAPDGNSGTLLIESTQDTGAERTFASFTLARIR